MPGAVRRTRVPGSWLVGMASTGFLAPDLGLTAGGAGVTGYPNPQHRWDSATLSRATIASKCALAYPQPGLVTDMRPIKLSVQGRSSRPSAPTRTEPGQRDLQSGRAARIEAAAAEPH